MDVIELRPRLHFVRLPVGHAYLWQDSDGLTLVDRELTDGDEPGFGDGAVVIAVPGHTPGSIALYLPRHGVLCTGDAVARRQDGTVICGIFNVDRPQAAASLRRLATLGVSTACFGHGDPLTRNATKELRSAAHHLPPPQLSCGPSRAALERCTEFGR